MANKNSPQFPIYIVSKGRSKLMITSRQLTLCGVKHYIVVEPSEAEDYRSSIKEMSLLAEVIELDMTYKERYELCDDLGMTRSTGPGPARNFAWDHAIKSGFAWHWVMDDNILSFRRFNYNEKVKVTNGSIFRAMEDFVLRYENVAMAGPQYFMFIDAKSKRKPFTLNNRIYSCNLIRNDIPFRWRGRYNEDTIISVDCLKAGWCTIQFVAFLQEKAPTQTVKGGNTEDFYHKEGTLLPGQRYAANGTLAKSQMQVKVHPDVSKLTWRYGRWHHHVDYSPFKKNQLIKKKDLKISEAPDNYGMVLKKRIKNATS